MPFPGGLCQAQKANFHHISLTVLPYSQWFQESVTSALSPQTGSGPLASQGEALALVVHQDVTALKEAEALKDEFVGIVAHELRAPLAALRGFADMLFVQTARHRGPPLSDWQQAALREISVAVERMVTLTEDLLDVTRLQTGRLQLQRAPTNLASLAQRAASLLQKTTTCHQIEMRATRERLVADIDPGRIEQVLTNLIGNAIKYSPQGGSIIVSLWEEADAGAVGLSVRDHGIGIPASQQGLVFGRFMRADNAAAWGIGGSGLGLYISRELASPRQSKPAMRPCPSSSARSSRRNGGEPSGPGSC
jgi:signal transduction histidine kinase